MNLLGEIFLKGAIKKTLNVEIPSQTAGHLDWGETVFVRQPGSSWHRFVLYLNTKSSLQLNGPRSTSCPIRDRMFWSHTRGKNSTRHYSLRCWIFWQFTWKKKSSRQAFQNPVYGYHFITLYTIKIQCFSHCPVSKGYSIKW